VCIRVVQLAELVVHVVVARLQAFQQHGGGTPGAVNTTPALRCAQRAKPAPASCRSSAVPVHGAVAILTHPKRLETTWWERLRECGGVKCSRGSRREK
jgi:hypothetical protein